MPLPPAAARIGEFVPFVHATDVGASLEFYSLLGFTERDSMRGPDGVRFWAAAESRDPSSTSGPARIMFARASGPIDPTVQAVIFYMYCRDVAGLRTHLLAHGLHDGGVFTGLPGPNGGLRVVFSITHPHYMPAGEIRISDPDGYCILVGQRA